MPDSKPALFQTLEISPNRPSLTKPAILLPANQKPISGPVSATRKFLIAVLYASCSIVFNSTLMSGLATLNFSTNSATTDAGAASDWLEEITRFPPAKLRVGKAPKATAVTAVFKNDFILISLFIFIAHIVYVSATMSRVKSQKPI